MPFPPPRIPIVVLALPDEAVDSWIEAYARRLLTSSRDFLGFLGLAGSRPDRMAVRLTPAERQVLDRVCGVDLASLTDMTLEPFDGIAVNIAPGQSRTTWAPAWRRTNAGRYCPACLCETGGRWQLAWRLPWTFACPRHKCLLADVCPRCDGRPVAYHWRHRPDSPSQPSRCATALDPRGRVPGPPCDFLLTDTPACALPGRGAVLRAQAHINHHMAARDPQHRERARLDLHELHVLAYRTLHVLHTHSEPPPQPVRDILDECGGELPMQPGPLQAEDAHAVAAGSTAAVIAQRDGPDGDAVLAWIVRGDRSYRTRPEPRVVLRPWRNVGTRLMARVLAAMDGELRPTIRLRYASATPAARPPDRSEAQIRRRAAMTPATLWPSWSMRLLPNRTTRMFNTDINRAALSTLLLLPGGEITYLQAAHMLRQSNRTAASKLITHGESDLTPILAGLAQLAAALDTHGSPIDYARRRALFTPTTVRVDRDAYAKLCAEHGWHPTGNLQLELLDHQLLCLLTGSTIPHPDGFAAKDPHRRDIAIRWRFPRYCTPAVLRTFLNQQSRTHLHSQGVEEPTRWEPPARLVTGIAWAGVEPDTIDHDQFARLPQGDGALTGLVRQTGLSREHISLYGEANQISSNDTDIWAALPNDPADLLAAERLHDLYVNRGLSLRQLARYSLTGEDTLLGALANAGIDIQPSRRTRLISREWLEDQHRKDTKAIKKLAREQGISPEALARKATKWGLTFRRRSRPTSPFDNTDIPLSPQLLAAFTGPRATQRLRRIVQMTGHPSTRAAAAAFGTTEQALHLQIKMVQRATGLRIFERTHPIATTAEGFALIEEATHALELLDWRAPLR